MEPLEILYKELLSGNPSQATYLQVLSRMTKEGMLEDVIREAERALKTYPDDIKVRRLLAGAYLETGRVAEAESEIITVISLINELMTCYRFHADLLITQGKNSEAIDALKLYLIHCPDDKESYTLLESMQAPGETAEPVVTAATREEAQEPVMKTITPEMPDICTATLAEVYFNQGRIREAIETYKKVIEKNPDALHLQQRLDELTALMEETKLAEEKEKDRLRRSRKMISILESWLEGIREQSKSGLSIG